MPLQNVTRPAPQPTPPVDGTPLEVDYLVIGTGASAMAFVDTLLDQQPEATVLMVDRLHRPGGHWNHAYPWVRVHQPSAWYGVASRELAGGEKEKIGLNAGMYSMASGAEVLAHFEQVMQQRFLPSDRVRWLPMTDYQAGPDGTHRLTSRVSGKVQTVQVRRKVVDGTHARTEVPATHPPRYTVAPGVACIPINGLAALDRPYTHYTVVGAGKTGIDACLWLLDHGIAPSRIRWIIPRDAWFMDRANLQPGLENFERNMGYSLDQFGAIIDAASPADVFVRLEARGALLRLDPAVEPSTYRCCTISPSELALLRRIADVVRLGRLRAIEPTRIVLDRGAVTADPDTLYIDCSASAIQPLPGLPVFDGPRINLFMVRTCQPVFSAAVIAFVESHVHDDAGRNALCAVVPSPEVPQDWLRMWAVSLANAARWRQHPALHAWLMRCRLNAPAVMARGVARDDSARMALLSETGKKAGEAAARLPALLAML
jgi:hypothetical protein